MHDKRGTDTDAIHIATAVEHAINDLAENWVSAAQADRVVAILRSFGGFCMDGYGVEVVERVSSDMARSFVFAPLPGTKAPPSIPLMHLRRLAVRVLFRSARRSDPQAGDPTLDLALPPRTQCSTRPLVDDEVALCRAASGWNLTDQRRAAAWALAEATCGTGELGQITVGDCDLGNGRVWIHDGRITSNRWGFLTEWGHAQLDARLRALPTDPTLPVVYGGSGGAKVGQISSSKAINEVLARAGLGAEPGVRPASVAGWIGASLRRDGLPIEEVARRLGMSSLDRTARFIGWDWKAATPH